MHSSLVEIIHRSGRKGGLGLISDPKYWAGMPADGTLNGDHLHLLFTEIYLQEMMGELPLGSAMNFYWWVNQISLLRPDWFFATMEKWAQNNYGKIIPVTDDIQLKGELSIIGIYCASKLRNFSMEKFRTERELNHFTFLVNKYNWDLFMTDI
jgi:hypothetical protein